MAGMAGMAGMAERQKEWKNGEMAEVATYVLFMEHADTNDNDTLIFYIIESIRPNKYPFNSHVGPRRNI